MSNKNKYLPVYLLILGCFSISLGCNIILNEENKILHKEKKAYKVFNDYLYLKCLELKLELIENHKNNLI